MPRRKRDLTAGTFHIYTHSVWAASALFRDDADRMTFVRELARATARVGWTCMAYCLLTTHYHLLVEVEAGVLSDGMHALNFRYASYFNNRHRMKGHVFAARYESRRIQDEEHLLTVFRYIARNPVEAGLCRSAADWRWSSYPETIGCVEPSSFVDATAVLECFGGTDEFAVERLRRFVEDS
jgi:REP-associated tyrosine transposase